MKLAEKIATSLVIACVFAVLPLNVSAQSTCPDATNLRACGYAQLLDCRDLWSCSTDRTELLSVTDVVVDAAADCCDRPTNKANKCLKKNGRKLIQAAQRAPVFARRLFRQARNEVLALRTNSCNTGTLGEL